MSCFNLISCKQRNGTISRISYPVINIFFFTSTNTNACTTESILMRFGVLKTWSACRWIQTGSISHDYAISSYISTPGIVLIVEIVNVNTNYLIDWWKTRNGPNKSGLTSLLIGWFCRWLAKDPVRHICTAAMKENHTYCYVLYYYSYSYCYRYRYCHRYRFRY